MKKILTISVLVLNLCCFSCQAGGSSGKKTVVIQQLSPSEEEYLQGIQKKIYTAFVQSIIANDNVTLIEIDNNLAKLYESNQNNLILYWRSYLQFYSAIYYLEGQNKKQAEKETDAGINFLETIKSKNSEDFALLALIQSFSIQFSSMSAPFIANRVKKNAKKAIAIDSTNLRGYFVYASNDFYTPEMYGGGKEAEEYLLKAISLPARKRKNDYMPSWGKEGAYEMLIKFYIRKEQWTAATKYFKEGVAMFPEDNGIKELAKELVGK